MVFALASPLRSVPGVTAVPTSSRVFFTRAVPSDIQSTYTSLLSLQRYDLLAVIDGGSATGALAAILSPVGSAVIVWLCLSQPANAAAAASVISSVVRVMSRANRYVGPHRQGRVLASCRSGT